MNVIDTFVSHVFVVNKLIGFDTNFTNGLERIEKSFPRINPPFFVFL
jgi:hypothetical protein